MLQYHEISEANHKILNPLTEAQLMLLGQICQFQPGMTQLDLCCGKGEMLCRWAHQYDIVGVGVDISDYFLAAARQRATQLDVSDQVTFFAGDAVQFTDTNRPFDVVSCIGASWIGGGLIGTLDLMKHMLKPDGLLLVGEPYWITTPPPEALEAMGIKLEEYESLGGTLERIEKANCELVEMVLANGESWDRYMAAQWFTVERWLQQHPTDDFAIGLRAWSNHYKQAYLKYQRAYLGWGVFVVRPNAAKAETL